MNKYCFLECLRIILSILHTLLYHQDRLVRAEVFRNKSYGNLDDERMLLKNNLQISFHQCTTSVNCFKFI